MPAALPPRPSLEWLRKTAKDQLSALRKREPAARLADAQRAVARNYGFASWRALKAHIETAAAGSVTGDVTVAAFLRLVRTGSAEQVRQALSATPALAGARGPHPFWGGQPQPLHLAVEAGRADLTELLLDSGAPVDGDNNAYDWWSPLMIAIHNSNATLRDLLIARGATIGVVEALMMADDQRVGALLDAGILPREVPNGGSLLAFARTPFAIDRLLALGASADARDRWGTSPIEALSRLGARGAPLVRHLIARGVPAAPQEYARIGDLEVLARLADADPGIVGSAEVMLAAVDFRHAAIVEWLIGRGASVNARTAVGSRHTALHAAAWNGDLPMARLLVDAGADIGARDDEHNATPLGWAETAIEVTSNSACAEVAEYLRSRGAS